MNDDRNLRAALAYARVGWRVFPVLAGFKEPATKHGLLDATTDTEQITTWWGRNGGRNIGVATGWPGPDVLDIDQHGEAGNGFAGLNKLKRAGLAEGPQAIVRTPSGGQHWYFAGTEQRSGKLVQQHIDFRGAGGYVVAPPSVVSGRQYEVVTHQPVAAAFDWDAAKNCLEPERQPERPGSGRKPEHSQDLSHLVRLVRQQQKGNRNDCLFWAGNRALEADQPELLDELAQAAIAAGHPEREAWRTIQSLRDRAASRVDPIQRQAEAG